MAIYTANVAVTNLGTSAWDLATNTPTVHATTNLSPGTVGLFTATFTAPNLVNASTGVWILLATTRFSGTLTATLYESGVATAATATISNANLPATANYAWVYFRWASPYVFTTTTAGAYKVQIKSSASTGTIAADSGGTTIAYAHTDNRSGTPLATDDLWIGGHNGLTTPVTVTVTGLTNAFGSSGDSTGMAATSGRTIGHAMVVGAGGTLKADPTANSAMQPSGNVLFCGGNFNVGSAGTPLAFTFTVTMNAPSINAPWGIGVLSGSQAKVYGTVPTFTQTTFTSGLGTAGSPLVTADAVGWAVGDEIWIAPTSSNAANYGEGEYRFIITVNSPTSYVLSSTKGGAENALVNSHTAAPIVHLTRNVIFTASNATNGTFMYNNSTIQGDIAYSGVRFEYYGSSTGTNKIGIAMATSGGTYAQADHCVSYKSTYRAFFWQSSATTEAFTDLISVGSSQYGFYNNTGSNKTFTNCFAGGAGSVGYGSPATPGCTFTNFRVYGCNTAGGGAGMLLTNLSGSSFTGCEVNACRQIGLSISTSSGTTFTNCLIGTKGTNVIDIQPASSTLNSNILFTNCLFGSATLISNYLNQSVGSVIAFHKLNQTNNNHKWYTNYGSAQSTGATLSDTTVLTAGSLGVRLSPEENVTGFSWSFNIPAPAGNIINFFGWFQKNAAFGTSTAKVELFLPGSTVADATQTLSNVTGSWQAASLSASNTGNTVDGLATIKITAISATASAYLYADTFYNADTTQRLSGLDVWNNGQPVTLILPTAVSAADIWTFSTANLTTVGTTGKQQKDALTTAKFLGLK